VEIPPLEAFFISQKEFAAKSENFYLKNFLK